MTSLDITHQRLHNQRIASTAFEEPAEVAAWLGAVQAQDYLGALWAIGLRMRQATEEVVEKALADRTIIRTWPMRGTLHFVAAADVRWMLELMTPRIVSSQARRLQRQFEIDDAVLARSREALIRVLQGGRQLSRNAVYQALEAAQIAASGQRGLHILWRIAQEGLICFGAREGKQQTFALLDEWAPGAIRLERDAALAELARRYFTSHGPATMQDLIWWSGLTAADVQAGLEMVKSQLECEIVEGRTYWFARSMTPAKETSPTAYLLPSYDEYIVGYTNREAIVDPMHNERLNRGNVIFSPTIIIDGRVVGVWKRVLKKGAVVIEANPLLPLDEAKTQAFNLTASQYGAFLKLPITPA